MFPQTIKLNKKHEDRGILLLGKPDFDSGWLSLTPGTKEITHPLNTTEVIVYMTGKKTSEGTPHQIEY